MTDSVRYDLVVIGAGPAGEKGAAQAAYFNKRVAVIECAREVGGACVNTGTIPSKTLRETALYYSGLKQRGLYGIDYSIKTGISVPDFMYRLQQVQRNEWQVIRHNFFRHRVDLLSGTASFVGPHEVRVTRADGGTQTVAGDHFLIATGSTPHRPADIPFDDTNIFDSDSILRMDHIPRSLAVVGGGVIGCEYACIFAALGIDVTLIDGRDRPVPFVDREMALLLLERMRELGVRPMFNDEVSRIELHGDEVHLALRSGGEAVADSVLFAAGRNGATARLGLETVGVSANKRGQVEVDSQYRTTVPHIYAAGDVIGFPALASTSMEQARVAVCHAFGFTYKERISPVLPYGIYTIPELSMCGETEESCQEKGLEYLVGRASYHNNARGQIIGDMSGIVKLIFAPSDKRLLGVHILGENAAELVHIGMSCINNQGAIDTFINAVYNFPTLGELYKYAAYDGLDKLNRQAAFRDASENSGGFLVVPQAVPEPGTSA